MIISKLTDDLDPMVSFKSNITEEFPEFLNDESSIVQDGNAERLYFPKTQDDVIEIMKSAWDQNMEITISGGGTGIAGGRVPRGGWILATDKLNHISLSDAEFWIDQESKEEYWLKLEVINDREALLTVPAGMRLKSIQNFGRERGWFYPPDPTERSSFIGGNVSTNASGARSFKYGPTRDWVKKMNVILADGTLIELDREKDQGKIANDEIIIKINEDQLRVPRPKYELPKVTKHVAGPVITDDSHPLDLFVGTNGIFGVVTEISIRLVRPPTQIYSIFAYCNSVEDSFSLIQHCQRLRQANEFPVPMSVEFMDEKSVPIMHLKDQRINTETKSIIILEQDVY